MITHVSTVDGKDDVAGPDAGGIAAVAADHLGDHAARR